MQRSLKKFVSVPKLVRFKSDEFHSTKKYMDGGLNKLLGIELVDIQPKMIKMSMKISETHMGGTTHRTHGGAILTLGDTGIGIGSHLNKPKDATGYAVVDLNIKFISASKVGDELISTATQVHSGKTLQYWSVDISRNGKQIALVSGTVVNLYDQTHSHHKK
jgi:uncharacterized protein (TIGR00369 family)